MESDEGNEDLPDSGADTSEAESVAGTDPGKAEVEPEVTVRQHKYNLRPKRRAPVLDGDDVRAKEIEIAPGAGVVADKNHAGGRDAGEAGKRWGTGPDSSAPATRKTRSIQTMSDACRRGRPILATVSSVVLAESHGTSL